MDNAEPEQTRPSARDEPGLYISEDGYTTQSEIPARYRNNVVHLPDALPNESAEPDIEPMSDPSYDADPDSSGFGPNGFPTPQFHRDSESPSIDGSVVINHGRTGRQDLDGSGDNDAFDAAFERRCWRKIGLSRKCWKGEAEIKSIRRGMGSIEYDEDTAQMKPHGRSEETDLVPQQYSSLLKRHLADTAFLYLPTTGLFYPSTQVRSSASAALVHRLHHQCGPGGNGTGGGDEGEFGIRVLPRGLRKMEAELEAAEAIDETQNAERERLDPVSMRSGRTGVGGQALEGSFAGLNVMEDGPFGLDIGSRAGGDDLLGFGGRLSGRRSQRGQLGGDMDMDLMLGGGLLGGMGYGVEGFSLGPERDIDMR